MEQYLCFFFPMLFDSYDFSFSGSGMPQMLHLGENSLLIADLIVSSIDFTPLYG